MDITYKIGMSVQHKESGSTGVVVAIYGESLGVKVVKGKGGYHKGDNALWLKGLCKEA